MPTITFEANEHSALRVELRGLAASYAGAEIVLAGGPAYSDAALQTWASVAGVAVGDGEVAGYDLPLPQLEPGRFALEVYAATPGERRADLMPAPGETIVLKVGNRRHDDGDVTPPAQVTVQQGTSEVRAGDGGGGVHLYVADPSGTRLDGEATHTLASTAVRVVERKIDLPTDELGRVPSVPTDADGEVPLRARLDAIVGAAKGAATPSEVESLLSGLADAHETLLEKHQRLQGEHSNVLSKLTQVLDAVGQIPTEQGGWQKSEWLVAPVNAQAEPGASHVFNIPSAVPLGVTMVEAVLELQVDVSLADDKGSIETRLNTPEMLFPRDSESEGLGWTLDAREAPIERTLRATYKADSVHPYYSDNPGHRTTNLRHTAYAPGSVPLHIHDVRSRTHYRPSS